jgi:hypothetical protein
VARTLYGYTGDLSSPGHIVDAYTWLREKQIDQNPAESREYYRSGDPKRLLELLGFSEECARRAVWLVGPRHARRTSHRNLAQRALEELCPEPWRYVEFPGVVDPELSAAADKVLQEVLAKYAAHPELEDDEDREYAYPDD